MRKSLLWKLTLAFVLVALTTAGLIAVFIRLTNIDRLNRLIVDQQRSSLETSLADYYQSKGSWDGIANDWQTLRAQSSPTRLPTIAGQTTTGPRDRRRFFGLADNQGVVLVAIDPNYPEGSTIPADTLSAGTPVMVNGKQAGVILVGNFQPRLNPEENLFIQRTNEALVLAVLGAMLVAGAIGVFLALNLIRPIRALTDAAHNMAEGQLDQQVNVKSKDEIGELAGAFNRMSQEITRVNVLRRQMTADIAHDLRTPLTVIGGYVESMRDGVLKPTPERLALIYAEIERLQNLVGDLKMLSQVDAGELPLNPQMIPPRSLLERAAATFQHRASQGDVKIQVQAEGKLADLMVDEARMMQVFGNLLSNALRYTPAGGNIVLSARQSGNQVLLSVEDNGEGISDDELPHIFERFHRADKSRHAEAGETGLGLAIVKALIEAQHGTVVAESKIGQGTTVTIRLPSSKVELTKKNIPQEKIEPVG